MCYWLDRDIPCDPTSHIWTRRADLTGVDVLASWTTYEPNAMLAPDGTTATGYFPDLFHILQATMNFTYTYIPPPARAGPGRRLVSSQSAAASMINSGLELRSPKSSANTPAQVLTLAQRFLSSSDYR